MFNTHVLIYYFSDAKEKISYDFVRFENVIEFKKDANFKKIKELSSKKIVTKGELHSFKTGVNLALVQIHIMKMKATMGIPFVFYDTMTLQSNIFLERDRVNWQFNLRGGASRYEEKNSKEPLSKGNKRVIVYSYVYLQIMLFINLFVHLF